jgi:hypothetical protein
MNFEETATLKIGGQTGQVLLQAVRDFPHLRKTKNILFPLTIINPPHQKRVRAYKRVQRFEQRCGIVAVRCNNPRQSGSIEFKHVRKNNH